MEKPLDIMYNIPPTTLDSYTDFKRAEEIYETYYGWSENPSVSLEDFCAKKFQDLIDHINKVPFDSEAADKGTAFNEVVDCIVEHRNSNKVKVAKVCEQIGYDGEPIYGRCIALDATLNNRTFRFPIELVREFSDYYQGASTQVFVEGVLPTCFGNVRLYGYVDELMPFSVHDIKTTSSYSVGKFKKKWQHIIYPYCLNEMGNSINTFEYNITDFKETYTETYIFNKERDVRRLRDELEEFITFLNDNREQIKNAKIFNYRYEQKSE